MYNYCVYIREGGREAGTTDRRTQEREESSLRVAKEVHNNFSSLGYRMGLQYTRSL